MTGYAQMSGKAYSKLTIGPRTLTVRPLQIGSYAEMEAYYCSLRDDPISAVIRSMPNIPQQYHDQVLKTAVDLATKARLVTAQEMNDFEGSPRGIAFKLWCALRTDQPNDFKSPDDALHFLEEVSEHEAQLLMAKLDALNDKAALGNSSGPTPTPTATTEEVGPTSTGTSPPNSDGATTKSTS